jgi:hypothetical protein
MVLTRPPPPDLVRSASSLLPSSSPTRREWHDGHGEGSDDGGNGTQAVGMTLLPLEIEMSGRKQRGRNVSDVPSAARKPDIASLMTTVPPLTGCLAWSSARSPSLRIGAWFQFFRWSWKLILDPEITGWACKLEIGAFFYGCGWRCSNKPFQQNSHFTVI